MMFHTQAAGVDVFLDVGVHVFPKGQTDFFEEFSRISGGQTKLCYGILDDARFIRLWDIQMIYKIACFSVLCRSRIEKTIRTEKVVGKLFM